MIKTFKIPEDNCLMPSGRRDSSDVSAKVNHVYDFIL